MIRVTSRWRRFLRVVPLADYSVAVAVSGAGHHPVGESAATASNSWYSCFASGLCGVA